MPRSPERSTEAGTTVGRIGGVPLARQPSSRRRYKNPTLGQYQVTPNRKRTSRIASHPTGLLTRFLPAEMPGEQKWKRRPKWPPLLKLTSTLSPRGRTCRLRIHRRNLLQQRVHAAPSLQSGVDCGMAFSVRVRDQDAGPRLRLLDHIG
jgi:hypothetical protein